MENSDYLSRREKKSWHTLEAIKINGGEMVIRFPLCVLE